MLKPIISRLSQFPVLSLSQICSHSSRWTHSIPLLYCIPALYATCLASPFWCVFILFARPAISISTLSLLFLLHICCCTLVTCGLMKILAMNIFLDLLLAILYCHFCEMILFLVKYGTISEGKGFIIFAVSIPWPERSLWLVPRLRSKSCTAVGFITCSRHPE